MISKYALITSGVIEIVIGVGFLGLGCTIVGGVLLLCGAVDLTVSYFIKKP